MRASSPPTCWTRGARLLLEEADRRGYDRAPLLAAMGPSARRVADPEARIPLDAYYALVERVADGSGEPWFGLRYAATRRFTDGLDAVGFLALSSATLGEAFERVIRYQTLLRAGERYALDVDGRDAVFRFTPWGAARPAHAHVAMICAHDVLSAPRALAGVDVTPRYCHFRSDVPGPTDDATRLLGVRPDLGAREDAWAFPRDALALPMPRADARLARFFEGYLHQHAPADDLSVREQIARHLEPRLADGHLSLRSAARALGLSPRTLQRRLAEEHSSFEKELDDLRSRRARALLGAGVSSVEVAYLVGYEDTGALGRAVRRWGGAIPRKRERKER